MNLLVCNSTHEIAQKANHWLRTKVSEHSAESIFVPAGQTPLLLYQKWELARKSNSNDIKWMKPLVLRQVDEIVSGPKQFEFRKFFETNLPSFTKQFRWIEAIERPSDLAILGFGRNGHVAFHEPGIPHPFFGGHVRLTSETQRSLGLNDLTWALTYGAETFVQSRAVLLMVQGAGKGEAFQNFLAQQDQVPACRLFLNADLTVLVHKELHDESKR